MGIVSSVGIGSGVDIQSLVTQLASAESQPALNAINRKKVEATAELSGLGTLKSALSDFRSAVSKLKDGNLFKSFQTQSSNETALTASASAQAVPGSYSVEVVSLAKAQKAIASAEFTADSRLVGAGTLNFSTPGGDSFSIQTYDTTTLEGLRDAINRESDNSFVSASIVNVDHVSTGASDPLNGTTVSKLVLTSKNSGVENGFSVSGTDGDSVGISAFYSSNLQPITEAKDAVIRVDGQTATRATNDIADVLPGVSLNLLPGSEGTTVDVQINLDQEAIKATLGEFVNAYNKLASTTKNLGKYGGSTDGSGAGNGALIGDSTLRLIANQIRQSTTKTVSSTTSDFNSLAMIGISVDKDGTMSLDSSKFASALNADLQSISDVFSSSDGVATRLNERLNSFLQSGGPLDGRQTSLKNQLSNLDNKQLDVEERRSKYEAMLLKQFTAMDITVGSLNSTGSFLSNWIKQL